mgnify:CR=1 FL=1
MRHSCGQYRAYSRRHSTQLARETSLGCPRNPSCGVAVVRVAGVFGFGWCSVAKCGIGSPVSVQRVLAAFDPVGLSVVEMVVRAG